MDQQTCRIREAHCGNKAAYQTHRYVRFLSLVPHTITPLKLKKGLCFGHQIIARAFGSECVPNGGRWEIGPTTIQLTDFGKQFFGGVNDLVSL